MDCVVCGVVCFELCFVGRLSSSCIRYQVEYIIMHMNCTNCVLGVRKSDLNLKGLVRPSNG